MHVTKFFQSLIIGLTLSASAAAADASKPTACPTTDAIKKESVNFVKKNQAHDLYVGSAISTYGSSNVWGFVMAMPADQAVNDVDALNKVKAAVLTLSGTPLPRFESGQWICMYQNTYNYFAVAITPLHLSNEMLPKKIN